VLQWLSLPFIHGPHAGPSFGSTAALKALESCMGLSHNHDEVLLCTLCLVNSWCPPLEIWPGASQSLLPA